VVKNGRKAIKNPRKSAKIRVIRIAIIPTGGTIKMAARPSKIRVNPLYPRHPRCHYSYGRHYQNGRKAIKNPRKSALSASSALPLFLRAALPKWPQGHQKSA